MKIGIDVDGVLIDFEERIRCRAEIFHYVERKKAKPTDNNFYWVKYKYGWNAEERKYFENKYLIQESKESIIKPGAKEIIELLRKEGNEIIIISSRGMEFDDMITIVEEKIKEANIKIDKCYWKVEDKIKICQDEKIDVMIDDNPKLCEKLVKNNINTLYFRNIYGEKLEENENLQEVHDWGNVYRILKFLKSI